jgi:hypothetical protein
MADRNVSFCKATLARFAERKKVRLDRFSGAEKLEARGTHMCSKQSRKRNQDNVA